MSTKKQPTCRSQLAVDSYLSDIRSRSDSESSQRESDQGNVLILNQLSINLEEEFTILKTITEGTFSKIILGKEKSSTSKGGDKMILKAINNETTTPEDFNREMYYNYFLSPHPNVVTSYNVSFFWDNNYVYVQEYALLGDLSRFIRRNGQLIESQVKSVALQLSSALEFIHGLNLVHRDLILENILVFQRDLSVVKICDFASIRPEGTLVTKTKQDWVPFMPPEICTILRQEKYYCYPSYDVWQIGIILVVCLTGSVPWRSADILTDSEFGHYCDWRKRKCIKVPESFQSFSPRLIRLLKRLLEPKPTKRCKVQEIRKYMNDDWIVKGAITVNSSNKSSLDRSGSCYNNNAHNNLSSRCSQRRRSIRPQSQSASASASASPSLPSHSQSLTPKRRSTGKSIKVSPTPSPNSSENRNVDSGQSDGKP